MLQFVTSSVFTVEDGKGSSETEEFTLVSIGSPVALIFEELCSVYDVDSLNGETLSLKAGCIRGADPGYQLIRYP
jgi:hypothetical protein